MASATWSQRRALAGALAVLATLVALDAILGDIVLSATYAIAAVVAAAVTTARRTAAVALLALVLSGLAGAWNDNFATVDWAAAPSR